MQKTDFLIIGSGIAGLALALELSQIGEVVILTKKDISAGSTGLAQGGIAGVRDTSKDTFEQHFEDTIKAGSNHNDKKAVQFLVKNAPSALKKLEKYGVKFDFSLHKEGGHSLPRISHVADETGRAVQEILTEQVKKNKKIKIIENAFTTDLLVKNKTAYGVSWFDGEKSNNFYAQKIILSTGGCGQIYKKTTNPSVATGDGIAMAIRAGAKTKDLEFVQFHPTAFDYPRDPLFLLSEALRGDGAYLVNEKEERFTDELAPRDKVARAIFRQKKAFLDFRHEKREELAKKFPNIFENLLTAGYDLSKNLVPITPAGHFMCGGVLVDTNGETSIKNLFALGEVACTGVHGANRLASNSLLEAVVFAQAIFDNLKKSPPITNFPIFEIKEFIPEKDSDKKTRKKLQEIMWEKIGLIRTEKGLKEAIKKLNHLKAKGTETKNLLTTAIQVAKSAHARKKSLGAHFIEN